jgi:hypothetical protein
VYFLNRKDSRVFKFSVRGEFWGLIGQDPSASKPSRLLHVDIFFGLLYITLSYIL